MKKNNAWKDNCSGNTLQYDFFPPKAWDSDRVLEECRKNIELLRGNFDEHTNPKELNWLSLAQKLPKELLHALIIELENENQIIGIGSSNWPNPGSIVVNIRNRFCAESKNSSPNISWRSLDDPHYCKEEMNQIYQGTEYLIIC